ncbi:MBL fold metallo-hydrolase [uncultured Leifsonia sp.]|uniref:MBL fold metallo-hydrolase n=1 Tax=uncultured Leifsonia sp. TaxID=340359 RepID=UPI0025EBBB7A|nr:MBL fold metallo-hydrolase [uncultured Leifsonia sp.]
MTDTATVPVCFRPLGGPTVLIEYGKMRFLVDPTFDPAGVYSIGSRVLTKTNDAVVGPEEVAPVDAVLLSHDQHPDNLDLGGRAFAQHAPLVVTTRLAASRLAGNCRGLQPGETIDLGAVSVTAVPALHGPEGSEDKTGPVIGFVLEASGSPTVYVSGDNASLAVVRQIAQRFARIDVAVLFAGAARTPLVDGFLTLTNEQAVDAARILGYPLVLPVHTDGWAHFTQDGESLRAAFEEAGLARLLLRADPAVPARVGMQD